jgi:hypothetical protein
MILFAAFLSPFSLAVLQHLGRRSLLLTVNHEEKEEAQNEDEEYEGKYNPPASFLALSVGVFRNFRLNLGESIDRTGC